MPRSFKLLSMLIAALLVTVACTALPSAPGEAVPASGTVDGATTELVVFAAASLTDAFGEIGTRFESANPGTTVVYNFGGSQQLAQQLGQGAPADVFASANARQMEVAVESGRVISGTPRNFVHNRLVVIYPADNQAGISTLQDLTQPGLHLVLAAPEVPVGAYSLDFLNKAAATVEFGATYSETVLSNVVSYEENVRSVLSKVVLGEADAGIVYTSDVFGYAAAQVGQIDIPDALNTVASYPLATVADSAYAELAAAFVDYVLGEQGQQILADFGFVPIASDEP